jgi:hypothetical protein
MDDQITNTTVNKNRDLWQEEVMDVKNDYIMAEWTVRLLKELDQKLTDALGIH